MVASHEITSGASLRGVLDLPRNTKITLDLRGLCSGEAEELQRQMNGLLAECGCGLSAACLVAGVIASIVLDAIKWRVFQVHPVRTILIDLAICFVAAALGKASGLLYARWKLGRIVRSLSVLTEEWPNSPAHGRDLVRRTQWDA